MAPIALSQEFSLGDTRDQAHSTVVMYQASEKKNMGIGSVALKDSKGNRIRVIKSTAIDMTQSRTEQGTPSVKNDTMPQRVGSVCST